MSQPVDFHNVSTVGLESSPVAEALAGLRANEARYFANKYDHVFTVDPAADATETVDRVHGILESERDIVIAARPLEATAFVAAGIRFAYVFYESGLSVNVLYGLEDDRSGPSGSSCRRGCRFPTSSRRRSGSRGRSNAHFCRGLLHTRYPDSTSPQERA